MRTWLIAIAAGAAVPAVAAIWAALCRAADTADPWWDAPHGTGLPISGWEDERSDDRCERP